MEIDINNNKSITFILMAYSSSNNIYNKINITIAVIWMEMEISIVVIKNNYRMELIMAIIVEIKKI